MSLSRAFTTRRPKPAPETDSPSRLPQRSYTTKSHPNLRRNQISAPVELVHTTNMLSYNAPDLPRSTSVRNPSNWATRSDDDSEVSATPTPTESTPPTSPDTGSAGSIEPNHLSSYFMTPGKAVAQPDAPVVPKRSPSHTKKHSYETMARNRSVSRQRSFSRMSKDSDHSVSTKASMTFSRSSSTSTNASSASHMSAGHAHKQAPPPVPPPVAAPVRAPTQQHHQGHSKDSHPFGAELAQVTELAEEYSSKGTTQADAEDAKYLASRGLVSHNADEYLSDVQGLLNRFFPEASHARTATPLWI